MSATAPAGEACDGAGEPAAARPKLGARLLSRRAAVLLARNTVVSCTVFGLNLALLFGLVESAGIGKLTAASASFLVANSLHYGFGRAWIFRGTERPLASGYVYFLLNAGAGLAVTIGLYAALIRFTAMDYLLARIVVSVFAGLIVFVLNAVLNFRRL